MRAASTCLWIGALIALLAGCATSRASQPATVTLQRPVHFTTSDGTVVAPAGTYRVEQSEPSKLTLVPTNGGKSLVVEALTTNHRQRLDSPVALSIPQENGDVHHVVLLLPGKTGLDAPGSYSGARPRGTLEEASASTIEEYYDRSRFTQPTVRGIAAGKSHSLFFSTRGTVGTVWAWGDNSRGQLGDQTTESRNTPVQVHNLSGVKALAAGRWHSLALKMDGTVWAWGDNSKGQAGADFNDDAVSGPVRVGASFGSALTGVKALAAGRMHSLALKEDGTVWAWGDGSMGQRGDGSPQLSPSDNDVRTVPVQVSGLSGVKAIEAGGEHSLAIQEDGTLWAWGSNTHGQLGDGTTTARRTPVLVGQGVLMVAAGQAHTLALATNGTVSAWGLNASGQLGDGTTLDRVAEVQVAALSGVKAIAANWMHSLAILEDGTLWAWGSNTHGQVGGATQRRPTPLMVTRGMVRAAAGFYHSLVLTNDGTAWAWGNNYWGQLGDGTNTTRPGRVRVQFPE